MEEYKKDDRGRSKAKRLTQTDPHTKVDSSTWTPPEPEDAGVKTGARPLVKRLYKKGGKVVGKHEGKESLKHAGRKPRKAGGRTDKLTPDSLINRDVRTANEVREGKKHDGAFKKGGKAHKFGGGPIGQNPISSQNQAMAKAAGMMKKGGKVHKKLGGKSTGVETDYRPSTYGEEKVNYSDKDNEAVSNIAKYGSMRGNPTASPDYPERKSGGKATRHPDEAQDKKLMHKVLKPKAFKAKGGKAMHHEDCTCKMCGGGRAMKYSGGGTFSGDSKKKVPGDVGGRQAHAKGGSTIRSQFNDAFRDARNQGLDTFEFNGKMYNTKLFDPSKAVGSGRGVSGPTENQISPPTRMGGTPDYHEPQTTRMGDTPNYQQPQTTYMPGIRQGGAGEPAIVLGNPSSADNDPSSYAARERAFIQQQNQRERDSMDAAINSDLTPRAGQRPVDFSDQPNAQARGGRSERNKGGRTKGNTTIIIDMGGRKQMQPQPMGMGQMPNAPVNPMRQPQQQPPMPPQGGMPPMPPMPPQGMPMQRKAGGRTSYPIDTGAGGANARLEKIDAYGLKPTRRK